MFSEGITYHEWKKQRPKRQNVKFFGYYVNLVKGISDSPDSSCRRTPGCSRTPSSWAFSRLLRRSSWSPLETLCNLWSLGPVRLPPPDSKVALARCPDSDPQPRAASASQFRIARCAVVWASVVGYWTVVAAVVCVLWDLLLLLLSHAAGRQLCFCT